ncbi:PLP-dependent transferase [Glonium stellatum]|uniref:PLP-dependent transferase n=1 Tax=Glonium stellatum TaxID=574774 RepID=A0A8E2FDY2_9PEZI|nr:PLP-dependent transferase [Glonium stellatum]
MDTPAEHTLSQRGWANVEAIMPKIGGAVAERMIKNNRNIDLSTAENWLIRPDLINICKDAIAKGLCARHLSYPRGFAGDPDLLEAYASFFNRYFKPYNPVVSSHLVTAPGAMAAIDGLLYNICDPGDGVLIPGPYWNGFDFGVRIRSSVKPVLVPLPSFNSNFTGDLLLALEEAFERATCPVKVLMITNPHNPLAVCYPKSVLEDCLKFCEKHSLHFISDEVYAMSTFQSSDQKEPAPFVSILSLNLQELGVDASRVHMVWSTSKDFGQSGFRMGCTVTQSNQEMAIGLALATNTQISSLSTIFVTSLLTSKELPSLIMKNSERLAAAYKSLADFFKKQHIPYYPCNAGLYMFAQLAPDVKTWEEESSIIQKLKEAGVIVSAGRSYNGPETEKGWARVGFAVDALELEEAIRRMRTVFVTTKGHV